MDVLSDVLQMIRLEGALFLNAEFREPWCVNAPRGSDFAPILCPGAPELAIVHLVLEGRCWIRLPGGEAVALEAGDVATLPRGDAEPGRPAAASPSTYRIANAVAAKVAESLFVEALRAYIDESGDRKDGWLAGLRDPQVGRCLALMHARPAATWSVESLAQEVHMSRSALAERFNELVGEPPMQYLKQWRLATAARLLCNERSSLQRVAEAVGYESEASFSRAFKAQYGVAPGLWRSGSARRSAAPTQ